MKYCVLLCGLLLMQAVGLSAKERARLQADGVNISRSGDSVHVSFRLRVERLTKDYILRVTPLLYGKDGQHAVLPPLEYGSRMAQIVEWREKRVKEKRKSVSAYHKAGETVAYTFALPYGEWMNGASLRLDAKSKGCCSEEMLPPVLLAADVALIAPVEQPVPVMPELVPAPIVETVAEQLAQENTFLEEWTGSTRSDEAAVADDTETALAIHFPIGKWEVLPDYENNHIALDHLVSVLNKIAGAKDSRIARILVVGAASPDGSAKQNEYLAGKRAQALTDYITSYTALSPSLFEISNIGVAWNALRALVADSDMAGRQQVLNIIDTVPVWDATRNTGRLGLIMQLNQGKTYEYMKRHFFPKLRNAGYIKVFYEAQP
ncbi:OmpA family protein [Bacteroides stercoris]|uniref:OmpA family protein n=1 Tax=Bacteroides stercoris TaxID=46506 RepID=A0A108T3S6_BACSE|nr:OmpA family protein [Bacteroides stercoris]KWR52861.1 OmpA family protein [Bacteroides stercoris]